MAEFTVNPHRKDPYRNFKFRVLWDGSVIPGISRVSGLSRTTDVIRYRQGNEFSVLRSLPGVTRYGPIVLERGVTHDTAFEDWARLVHNVEGDAAMSLKNFRKDIAIELLNLQGTVVKRWVVHRCWVARYDVIDGLDANDGSVALERIVLENEGWERDLEVTEPTET